MKKIIYTLAVIILIAGCSPNSTPTPPPVVNTCRDASVRFGIKVASTSPNYFVTYKLTPNPANHPNSLPPSNGNVVFTTPATFNVCDNASCGGVQFSGVGSPDFITWYSPVGGSFNNITFVAYIMIGNDTVFKKASVYDAVAQIQYVNYSNECLKKL